MTEFHIFSLKLFLYFSRLLLFLTTPVCQNTFCLSFRFLLKHEIGCILLLGLLVWVNIDFFLHMSQYGSKLNFQNYKWFYCVFLKQLKWQLAVNSKKKSRFLKQGTELMDVCEWCMLIYSPIATQMNNLNMCTHLYK